MSNDTLHTDLRDTTSDHDAQQRSSSTTPIAGIDAALLSGSARVSRLIGSNVYKGDTSIGQIEDVLVDLGHAASTAFILSVGGFLGIGNKLVAVPINQVKVGSEAKIMTDLTEAQLVNAPTFDFELVDQFSEGKH